MITSRLARRHLVKNKKRSVITLLGIILSVAMVTAIAGFAESARDMLRRSHIATTGDWHGMFMDVTEDDVARLMADERVVNVYTVANENRTNVYFRLRKADKHYNGVIDSIYKDNVENAEDGWRANRTLLMAEGVISDSNMTVIYSFCGILIAIVVLGSIIVIANAFCISANERIRQFGLLKSAGATKEQIRRIVLSEALLLAVIGIPMGLLTGFLVELTALEIANNLLREAMNIAPLFDGRIHAILSPMSMVISFIVSMATIILAAWFPAKKAAKISAIDAIRLTGEVKIKPQKVRTPRFVIKLFGIEGALADKSLKRSKSKYRATVVSLVVSMALFIGGLSFSEYLSKATGMVYVDYGINAYVHVIDEGSDSFYNTVNKLRNIDGMETLLSYEISKELGDVSDIITDKARDVYAPVIIRLHGLPDDRFYELCGELGVDCGGSGGVLINVVKATKDGKLADIKGINFTKGMEIRFGRDLMYSLTLEAETSEVPADMVVNYSSRSINVLVPESLFLEYVEGDNPDYSYGDPRIMATISLVSGDADSFCVAAEEIILNRENLSGSSGYGLTNIEKEMRANRNISLLVSVFILGFVGMLSLIAVTSVIGTISTNMNLRRQEFAMLQSVGMSKKSLRRMLNYESLIYGCKALVIGIPVGILVSWLFYRTLVDSLEFSYIFPLNSVIICVAAVLLLVFATMGYSVRGMDKVNIAETIRLDTV